MLDQFEKLEEEYKSIEELLNQYEKLSSYDDTQNIDKPIITKPIQEFVKDTFVNQFIKCSAGNCYQKSVKSIENTVVGNRFHRKRNLQQVIQESFFMGANKFGNNFIA